MRLHRHRQTDSCLVTCFWFKNINDIWHINASQVSTLIFSTSFWHYFIRRYFEEVKEEQEIRPGQVSEGLREALGLHEDKLPIWIYRMRVLGYPPGWLKKADVTDTVVPMLEVSGEGAPRQVDGNREYNPDQLVVYPGFNAPVPPGVRDDWQLLRMPPMQTHQQLSFATAKMKTPKPVPFRWNFPSGASFTCRMYKTATILFLSKLCLVLQPYHVLHCCSNFSHSNSGYFICDVYGNCSWRFQVQFYEQS